MKLETMINSKISTLCFPFLFTSILLISSSSLFGQAKSDGEKLTSNFFRSFKTDAVGAYDELFSNNKYISKSDLETTKIKLKDFIAGLGNYLGYEEITSKKAGESYILKSFLVKYERQPVRFTFILYRPSEVWIIQNFSYDTNLADELDNAAKLDRLKENW